MNDQLLEGNLATIHALLSSYTKETEHLNVVARETTSATYIEVWAHGNDTPAIVGKQGSHVKALSTIVAAMGRAADGRYILEVKEPVEPRTRSRFDAVRRTEAFWIPPAKELLERILKAIGTGDFVVSYAGALHQFNVDFVVHVRTRDDYLALTYNADADDQDKPVVAAALGTLFRAYGAKEGVTFQIDVALDGADRK